MARLAGVDLPRDKRIEIGLTYIYGIGRTTSNKILAQANVNPDTRVRDLTDEEVSRIKDVMDELCRQFPGKLIHIGGDEVSPAWKSCSLCRKRMDSLGVKTNQE